jgi:hypothetical protein
MDVRAHMKARSVAAERCDHCQAPVSFAEKVRHQGKCFSCSTEQETGTLFLEEPPTSIH